MPGASPIHRMSMVWFQEDQEQVRGLVPKVLSDVERLMVGSWGNSPHLARPQCIF